MGALGSQATMVAGAVDDLASFGQSIEDHSTGEEGRRNLQLNRLISRKTMSELGRGGTLGLPPGSGEPLG